MKSFSEGFPPEISVLFELQGLGAKKIKALYETLAILSITKLERACKEGRIALLPGFGPKSAENILRAIEQHKRSVGQFRLGDVMALAEELSGGFAQPSVGDSRPRSRAVIGARRRSFAIWTLLSRRCTPGEVFEDFVNLPQIESVVARGDTKTSVRTCFRYPMRSASRHQRRISVCVELFHRQQGAQRPHAHPGSGPGMVA